MTICMQQDGDFAAMQLTIMIGDRLPGTQGDRAFRRSVSTWLVTNELAGERDSGDPEGGDGPRHFS
jgi:hypothetical protein